MLAPLCLGWALLAGLAAGAEKCVVVEGRVRCALNPSLAEQTLVDLMDRDRLPWDGDDRFAWDLVEEGGNFRLSGCASDPGFWNKPDPYLRITHRCFGDGTEEGYMEFRKTLGQKWQPELIELGSIDLDDQGKRLHTS